MTISFQFASIYLLLLVCAIVDCMIYQSRLTRVRRLHSTMAERRKRTSGTQAMCDIGDNQYLGSIDIGTPPQVVVNNTKLKEYLRVTFF